MNSHPYGGAHKKLRAEWEPRIATGRVDCARCHHEILPTDPWELDHHDKEAGTYLGPAHRPCNRRGGPAYTLVQQHREGRTVTLGDTSRDW